MQFALGAQVGSVRKLWRWERSKVYVFPVHPDTSGEAAGASDQHAEQPGSAVSLRVRYVLMINRRSDIAQIFPSVVALVPIPVVYLSSRHYSSHK